MARCLGFFAAALLYEWLLAARVPWAVVLLVLAVVWSWRSRALGIAGLGLGFGDLRRSFRCWAPLWAFSAVLVVAIGNRVLLNPHLLLRAAVYFLWCVLQQLVFQSMIAMPLRGRRFAPVLAGAMFAAAHAPNPVLVPATFVWGIVSVLLFERCPSVWGLGLMQTMLSSVVLWLAGPALSHGFRVGPFY